MHVRGQEAEGLEAEHPQLALAATSLVDELLDDVNFQSISGEERTPWLQHLDYSERLYHLGEHLDEALHAARRARYASALVLVRTAFEQTVLDDLLLNAELYHTSHGVIDEATFEEWYAEFTAGEWHETILDVRRSRTGKVVATRRGIDVSGSDGEVAERLSPYHVYLEKHDPTVGLPSHQHELDDGLIDIETRKRQACENRDGYRERLSWNAMLDNLELNSMIDERTRLQMQVHYSFLSGFSHATEWAYKQTRSHQRSWTQRRPRHDHVLQELVLLYVIVLAVRELSVFDSYFADRDLAFTDRDDLADKLVGGRTIASYFWFPPDLPIEFDRIEEINRQSFRSMREGGDRVDPATVDLGDVRYYRDPLERLTRLHRTSTEMMTGLTSCAPWHT